MAQSRVQDLRPRLAGLPDAVWERLACPMCEAWPLRDGVTEACCDHCGAAYPLTAVGQLDMRLQGVKTYSVSFEVGDDSTGRVMPAVGRLGANPDPQLAFQSIELPRRLSSGNRLTPEMLSYFPSLEAGGLLLDLGCGSNVFRPVADRTNLEYVGVDYEGTAPRILADAHSLPFRDESFDFVMSFAVLEHVRYPFVVLHEIARVMKPGTRFAGTVAFLEPFHKSSFYHMTHLGTHNLLASGGLEVEHLEPNATWSGLRAIAELALFPRMPGGLARLMVMPVEMLHRLWWKLGHLMRDSAGSDDLLRQTLTTAGFRFVCRKPQHVRRTEHSRQVGR